MAQVCSVLPFLKELFAEGYSPVIKRNGRKVGSYHLAVATALREWFDKTPRGDTFNASKIRLTDGARALPAGLSLERAGRELRVAWREDRRGSGGRLLFAARAVAVNQWICTPVPLEKGVASLLLRLPAAWAREEVEVWVAFVSVGGRAKSQTLYQQLPPTAPLPTPGPGAKGEGLTMAPALAVKGKRNAARVAVHPVPPVGCSACRFGLQWHFCLVKRE